MARLRLRDDRRNVHEVAGVASLHAGQPPIPPPSMFAVAFESVGLFLLIAGPTAFGVVLTLTLGALVWQSGGLVIRTILAIIFVLVVALFVACMRLLHRWVVRLWASSLVDKRRKWRVCAACGVRLAEFDPESDGCTVCPECGAAWRLPAKDSEP